MYRTQHLFLKLVRGLNPKLQKDLTRALATKYDDQLGFGFVNTIVNTKSSLLSSTFIYRVNQMHRIFDPTTGTILTKQLAIYREVPFWMQFERGLLESSSGGNRLQRLISALAQLTKYQVTISDVYVDLTKFLDSLANDVASYKIIGISVNNYNPRKGLSGHFTASVTEQKAALELLRSYTTDVTEVAISTNDEDGEIEFLVASSGKVIVKAEEDSLEAYVAVIVSTVLGGSNA